MKKLLQLALITGSLLTGTLFSASEYKAPEATSAAAPAYPVVTAATWSPEQHALFNAVLAGNLSTVQRLHTEHPGILQTRFSGEFDGLPRKKDGSAWKLNRYAILHIAARLNALATVEKLITLGANVNAQDEGNLTPLHFAAYKGHANVAELLLDHRATVDAPAIDQCTPLHLAAQNGHANVAKLFLEHGANVDAQTNTGVTALEVAVSHKRQEIVRLLLKHEANIDLHRAGQLTPFHFAVSEGDTTIARIFLERRGSSLNLSAPINDTRDTLLHLAPRNDHTQMAQLLLRYGAKNRRNIAGKLAITPGCNQAIILAKQRTLAAIAGLLGGTDERYTGIRWVDATKKHVALPAAIISKIADFAGDLVPLEADIATHEPMALLTRYHARRGDETPDSPRMRAIALLLRSYEKAARHALRTIPNGGAAAYGDDGTIDAREAQAIIDELTTHELLTQASGCSIQ